MTDNPSDASTDQQQATPDGEAGRSAGSSAGDASGHGAFPHGSLSEEALKLAETLQNWLSTGSAMTGAGTSSECKVCPICQMIAVVNNMRPEVLGHLTEAGFALAAAFKAATESSEREWTSSNRPPVQHIKVT
jgi:hypothetical protein